MTWEETDKSFVLLGYNSPICNHDTGTSNVIVRTLSPMSH